MSPTSPFSQDWQIRRRDAFRLGTWTRTKADRPEIEAKRFDLLKAERRAMATSFELRIAANVPGALDLASRALELLDDLEAQMTVYRDDSEISRINATAHLAPVEVEPVLFELLRQAVELGHLTGGAYDITAGALSSAWGFTRGPKRVPSPEQLEEARGCTGFCHLILDRDHHTISFDRPGIVINLGSIGKGFAIDRAIAVIQAHWWPTSALMHGGHSSVYALGSPPDQFGGRWQVALRNPFDIEQPLGTIHLRNRGMGTSGDLFQRFAHEGRSYGHILDPRTGEPAATGLASVTVLAPTAAEADALSTAFSLLGPDDTRAILANRPEVGVIFVHGNATSLAPRVETIHLTDFDYTSNVIDPDRPQKFRPND